MPHPKPQRSAPLHRRLAAVFALLVMALVAVPASASASPALPAVQVHLLWADVDEAEMDRQLDKAQQAGVKMIRADFGWASLEQDGKGRYNAWYLRKSDMLVDKANARGIQVLYTVTHTPCWASSAPSTLKQGCAGSWWNRGVDRYSPNSAADYADAMAYLVRRYGSRVAAWELWNEPNSDYFFNSAHPAEEYAAMVKAAYPAMKAVDPSAVVVAGSLMESDWEFTEALYANGIKGNFDGFSFHPYSGDRSPISPTDPRYREHSFSLGVPAVREVLASHGDAKPLWLTEFGWSTANIRGGQTWENGVSDAVQASYLEQAYATMGTWDDIAAGVWFNLSDTRNGSSELVNQFGLLRLDGTEKPAFAAFKRAAAKLATATPAPAPQAPAAPAPTRSTAPAPAGSPAPAASDPAVVREPAAPKRAKPVTKVDRLTIRRSSKAVVVRGRARTAGVLVLRAFRYDAKRGRYATRAAFSARVPVPKGGAFSTRLAAPQLRRGGWRFVAGSAGTARTASL